MSLIILNGPTGTGKNTISKLVAAKRKRCAIVDFDLVRAMFANPHKAPWEGTEGHSQQILGVQQVCQLAKIFLENKFEVIILDVLSDETANYYKKELKPHNPRFIFLLPSFTEIQRRNLTRPPRLTALELEMIYKQQTELQIFDIKIDNTNLTPEEVAKQVNNIMNGH